MFCAKFKYQDVRLHLDEILRRNMDNFLSFVNFSTSQSSNSDHLLPLKIREKIVQRVLCFLLANVECDSVYLGLVKAFYASIFLYSSPDTRMIVWSPRCKVHEQSLDFFQAKDLKKSKKKKSLYKTRSSMEGAFTLKFKPDTLHDLHQFYTFSETTCQCFSVKLQQVSLRRANIFEHVAFTLKQQSYLRKSLRQQSLRTTTSNLNLSWGFYFESFANKLGSSNALYDKIFNEKLFRQRHESLGSRYGGGSRLELVNRNRHRTRLRRRKKNRSLLGNKKRKKLRLVTNPARHNDKKNAGGVVAFRNVALSNFKLSLAKNIEAGFLDDNTKISLSKLLYLQNHSSNFTNNDFNYKAYERFSCEPREISLKYTSTAWFCCTGPKQKKNQVRHLLRSKDEGEKYQSTVLRSVDIQRLDLIDYRSRLFLDKSYNNNLSSVSTKFCREFYQSSLAVSKLFFFAEPIFVPFESTRSLAESRDFLHEEFHPLQWKKSATPSFIEKKWRLDYKEILMAEKKKCKASFLNKNTKSCFLRLKREEDVLFLEHVFVTIKSIARFLYPLPRCPPASLKTGGRQQPRTLVKKISIPLGDFVEYILKKNKIFLFRTDLYCIMVKSLSRLLYHFQNISSRKLQNLSNTRIPNRHRGITKKSHLVGSGQEEQVKNKFLTAFFEKKKNVYFTCPLKKYFLKCLFIQLMRCRSFFLYDSCQNSGTLNYFLGLALETFEKVALKIFSISNSPVVNGKKIKQQQKERGFMKHEKIFIFNRFTFLQETKTVKTKGPKFLHTFSHFITESVQSQIKQLAKLSEKGGAATGFDDLSSSKSFSESFEKHLSTFYSIILETDVQEKTIFLEFTSSFYRLMIEKLIFYSVLIFKQVCNDNTNQVFRNPCFLKNILTTLEESILAWINKS